MRQDKDVPQILLRLEQAGQMLLPVVEDDDLIADVLLDVYKRQASSRLAATTLCSWSMPLTM